MRDVWLRVLSFGASVLTATAVMSGAALAAHPAVASSNPTVLGNDISWPQCGKRLPSGQTFGIVGVNDGLANNTNPCFAAELSWAQHSAGGTGQPLAALYVNTANPGLQGTWWPVSNTYKGISVDNPYGACDGTVSAACAYMYGYAKAYDDATMRNVANPSNYLWWLDVETVNTWQTDKTANAADLEGMSAYFQSIGASVGLYSTSYQWGQITGTVSSTSPLYAMRNWLAGASSQSSAKTMCSAAPLTADGKITITQFVSRSLDYDFSCV